MRAQRAAGQRLGALAIGPAIEHVQGPPRLLARALPRSRQIDAGAERRRQRQAVGAQARVQRREHPPPEPVGAVGGQQSSASARSSSA